ncbi:hypothetical protein DB32_007418 [Sandaracinus amylolyticus]|uniref:Uncharacterized protein n=1 Tax=Sandaracinus amylolyticus TaxID=927083 RepID=A0A0F6SHD8_9BACT|nr:hypothetical protein DB32_007418 [Sandaracinus amylolyticus]
MLVISRWRSVAVLVLVRRARARARTSERWSVDGIEEVVRWAPTLRSTTASSRPHHRGGGRRTTASPSRHHRGGGHCTTGRPSIHHRRGIA